MGHHGRKRAHIERDTQPRPGLPRWRVVPAVAGGPAGVPPFELSEERIRAHALAASRIRLQPSLSSTSVRFLAPADG